MGIYGQYKTDSVKENEGVKVDFPNAANEDGSIPTFVIARMGKANKKYTKALDQASKPYRRQLETGTMSNEVAEKLSLEVFCETVLIGWENVQDEDGKQIPFSKQKAIEVMSELSDLYIQLQAEANNAARFREEQQEVESKN